jgi:hypothetical protein
MLFWLGGVNTPPRGGLEISLVWRVVMMNDDE